MVIVGVSVWCSHIRVTITCVCTIITDVVHGNVVVAVSIGMTSMHGVVSCSSSSWCNRRRWWWLLLLLLLGRGFLFAAREKVVNPLVVGGGKENPWLFVASSVVGTTNHVGIIGSISGMLRKEVVVVVEVAVANGVGLWRACCTGRSDTGEGNGLDGTLPEGVVDGGHLALWHRLSFLRHTILKI